MDKGHDRTDGARVSPLITSSSPSSSASWSCFSSFFLTSSPEVTLCMITFPLRNSRCSSSGGGPKSLLYIFATWCHVLRANVMLTYLWHACSHTSLPPFYLNTTPLQQRFADGASRGSE